MTTPRLLERERVQQAQRLHRQAELIDLAHDAILVRDPISRIISWNRGTQKLYGWTTQEALGRVTHTLLKTRFPTSRAEVDTIREREGQWEGELVHSRRDGSTVLLVKGSTGCIYSSSFFEKEADSSWFEHTTCYHKACCSG